MPTIDEDLIGDLKREEFMKMLARAVVDGAGSADFRKVMVEAVKQGVKEWMSEQFNQGASTLIKGILHTIAVSLFGGAIILWATAGFRMPWGGGSAGH